MSFFKSTKEDKTLVKEKPPPPPEFKDEDVIVLMLHGMPFNYTWQELKRYPQFWITNRIITKGASLTTYSDNWSDPDVFYYVNRYMRYGVGLSLTHISKQFHCEPKDVLMMLAQSGFGKEICVGENDKTPITPVQSIPSFLD